MLRSLEILVVIIFATVTTTYCEHATHDWHHDCKNFQPYQWPWKKCKFPYSIQSPINIDTTNLETVNLPKLNFHLDWSLVDKPVTITNNGNTWSIALFRNTTNPPYITNGPLGPDKYIFEEANAHWSNEELSGSEHMFMGKTFAMEIRLVFFKEEYGSFEKAKNYSDGLAIAALFGEVSTEHNPHFDDLISKIPYILTPGSSVEGTYGTEFKFLHGVGYHQKYYAYPGSLTAPNYEESVTWIIFRNPFFLSDDQLNSFQQLITNSGNEQRQNDRELQYFNCRPLISPLDPDPVNIIVDYEF